MEQWWNRNWRRRSITKGWPPPKRKQYLGSGETVAMLEEIGLWPRQTMMQLWYIVMAVIQVTWSNYNDYDALNNPVKQSIRIFCSWERNQSHGSLINIPQTHKKWRLWWDAERLVARDTIHRCEWKEKVASPYCAQSATELKRRTIRRELAQAAAAHPMTWHCASHPKITQLIQFISLRFASKVKSFKLICEIKCQIRSSKFPKIHDLCGLPNRNALELLLKGMCFDLFSRPVRVCFMILPSAPTFSVA